MTIAYPDTARPHIKANHIDGPLLCMRSGELRWLTAWERVLLWFGKVDAEILERKYRPHLSR